MVCVWYRAGCGKRGFVSFSVISSSQASYKLEARLRAKSSLKMWEVDTSLPLSLVVVWIMLGTSAPNSQHPPCLAHY